MKIKRIVVGPIMTNCYLLSTNGNGEGVIIDPGDEAEKIAGVCRKSGITPRLVINTHAHYDHIGANASLKQIFPELQFAVGAIDAGAISDPMRNLSIGFGIEAKAPEADLVLEDGETAGTEHCRLNVKQTPGHTKGSISLLSTGESPQAVFCGDLIFADGVGRTDLPGGDAAALQQSICDLLSECSDDAILYPGHGPSITAGERKRSIAFS